MGVFINLYLIYFLKEELIISVNKKVEIISCRTLF